MSISLSVAGSHRALRIPWLLIGGYSVAAADLTAAVVYWAPAGVHPARVAQSIASWILGSAAFEGGAATALLGVFLYAHLMWGVVALYHALARRWPLMLRRPVACGVLYGVLAYAAIFQLLAPWLTGHRPAFDLPWIATCVVVYATLVGIPCALFARAATAATRQP